MFLPRGGGIFVRAAGGGQAQLWGWGSLNTRTPRRVALYMWRVAILLTGVVGLCVPAETCLCAPAQAWAASQGDEVARHAMRSLGTPYVWGGNGSPGFDCSGFVRRVYADFGYLLPRVSRTQAAVESAPKVERIADLEAGDLMFFRGRNRQTGKMWINHVGMYIGDAQFIHASRSKGKVVVSDIGRWARRHFTHARRVLQMPRKPDAAARLIARLEPPVRVAGAKAPRPATGASPGHGSAPSKPPAGSQASPAPKADEPVVVGGRVVRDPTLAHQLRGVDTTDPDQFEHAGEPLPPSMARYFDPFGGEVVSAGPRHLVRPGHTVGVGAGTVHDAGRQVFWISPELSLQFDSIKLEADLGFPIALLDKRDEGTEIGPDLTPEDGGWRDATRVLRSLTLGQKEAPLFLSASRYATASLGWGQLISKVSPAVVARDLVGAELGHTPLSLQADVNLQAVRLETFVDDAFDPSVVAGRLQLMPFILARDRDASPVLRELGAGLEVASLFGRGRAAAHMASVDLSTRLWMSGVHDTHAFVAGSFPLRAEREEGESTSATVTLGMRNRFRLGPRRRHALRVRSDVFFGWGRYRWLDNASYLPDPAPRDPDAVGLVVELGYKLAERLEIGALYAPDLHRRKDEARYGGDRVEAFAAVRDLALGRRVIGSAQVVYQGLLSVEAPGPSAHYVLADLHLRFARYFRAGVVARHAMAGAALPSGWRRWAFSFQGGFEYGW